jgi:hypothetical protein
MQDLIGITEKLERADPADDPLWLIHDFDIVDKQRELSPCAGTGSIVLPREMKGSLEDVQRLHSELDPAQVARHIKGHGPAQLRISFENFGQREIEPISQGLIKLFNDTVTVIGEFRAL